MSGSTRRLAAGAVAAVVVALLLYFPDRGDGSGAILGGFCALIAIPLGLAAVATSRPLPKRSIAEHTRILPGTIGLGVALGIANLLTNYGMAKFDPNIHEQMIARWAHFQAWSIVLSGPVMEEIGYRLVLMSGVAWMAARVSSDPRKIFYVALGVSSVIFGVTHIAYGGVNTPPYQVGMAVKSTAGGVLLGWVFWRRGLPHSIVCHCTANGTHLMLMPLLFPRL